MTVPVICSKIPIPVIITPRGMRYHANEVNLSFFTRSFTVFIAAIPTAREMNIPIKDLITHEFPLDQLNEAMEVNVAQQGIKICYVAK